MIANPSKKRSIDSSSTNTEEPVLFLRVKRRRFSGGGANAAAAAADGAPVGTTTTTNVLVLRVGFDGGGTDATTAALSNVTLQQQQQQEEENDSIGGSVAMPMLRSEVPPNTPRRPHRHSTVQPKTSATAVFRRVTSNGDYNYGNLIDTRSGDCHNNCNDRRRRILDAVLLEEEADDNDEEGCTRSPQRSGHWNSNNNNKRRKLTLQLLEPSNEHEFSTPQRSALQYPVWSPEQRAVDDSLQQVFQGGRSLKMHCDFIHTLAAACALEEDGGGTPESSTTASLATTWAWTWCQAESGNWLHAAALWNEAELVAVELGRWKSLVLEHQPPPPTTPQHHILRHLIQAVDGEGRTPVAVAHMSGHEAVQQVLESLAWEIYNNGKEHDEEYDLYCLMPDSGAQSGGEQTNEEHNDCFVLDCELHDGCKGYWDDRGELVLEPLPVVTGVDDNDNALENDSSDDEDSNREAWNGNDYPDDDECDDHWSCSTTGDASYGNQLDTDFRRRPANIMYGSDDEDYDPAYGLF